MATQSQVGAEGHAWDGLFASGLIPERFLDKGLDVLGKMSFITRHQTPFLSMITQKFPKAQVRKQRTFYTQELEELRRTFTVTVASTDTNHTQFGVSNAAAAEITENDMLYLRNTYATVQYTNMVAGQVVPGGGANVGPDILRPVGGNPTGVSFSRTWGVNNGNYFTDFEAVRIVSIGAPDSAGTGDTLITVHRCFFGPSGVDQGGKIIDKSLVDTSVQADTANAAIQTGDVFLRGAPAFKEGTGAPTGLHKSPTMDNNFTQEFKYGVEITKESEIDIKNISYSPLDINRRLTNVRMMLDMERTMIFGRKGVTSDSSGKKLYTTGGVVEFIPKDDKHILNFPGNSLNYSDFLDLGHNILDLGGSSYRDCFIGVRAFNAIKKSFIEHAAFRFDLEDSKNFGLNIESLLVSGGKLNLIPLHCMDEFGWGDKMLCLDLGKPSFVPVTHKNWDMKVETDIGEKGVQVYKEQIIGMKGLERRYAEYHSIVDLGGLI